MKIVPLTRGLTAIIDDQDVSRVLAHRWRAGKTNHGELSPVRRKTPCNPTTIRLSRFILELPRGMEIRHKNGDRFDCRRENLVVVSRGENQQRKPRPSSSGYRGVSRHRQAYQARITRDQQTLFLGLHATAEAAARRYDLEALRLYGSNARLNFPAVLA